MTETGVRAVLRVLFRAVWRVMFVLVVTLALLFAVGWAVRSLSDRSPEQVTTTQDR